jgi:hypothetical protein
MDESDEELAPEPKVAVDDQQAGEVLVTPRFR